ncbi:MAG: tRNA lysidine(34) synthetase TilS [Pyrinomonadaceae bacterium]
MNTHETQLRTARPKLSIFARSLMREWRQVLLPQDKEKVVVAVSGGADSTALFLALNELKKAGKLKIDIVVAHYDHGLRGSESKRDAQWVTDLARRFNCECEVGRVSKPECESIYKGNLEQEARRVRYSFLNRVARRHDSGFVVTAHTLDDQAETILLRLLRGAASDGLAGIHPVRRLSQESNTMLVRPLLKWAQHHDTVTLCRQNNVEYREDPMNEDLTFSRVRVRRILIPLLEQFNGRIVETLSRMAELLWDEALALEAAAARLLREAAGTETETKNGQTDKILFTASGLKIDVLERALPAIRRRTLRLWIAQMRKPYGLRRLDASHIFAIEKLIEGERGGRVAQLPGGCTIERRRGLLILKSAS